MTQADLFGEQFYYKDLKKVKELFNFKLKRMLEYNIKKEDITLIEPTENNEILLFHKEFGKMYFVSTIDRYKNGKYIDIPNFVDMFLSVLSKYFRNNQLTIKRKIA
jgi:hypothetical protein